MSEKRFTLRRNTVSTNYPSGKIFDNKKQHTLYFDEIVDLLNELDSIIRRDERSIQTMMSNMKKLEEKNEQLRKELDSFKPVMFQDMRYGTVRLYSKGGIDE